MAKNIKSTIADETYSTNLDRMDIPRSKLSAYARPVDTSLLPRDGVTFGSSIKKVSGSAAGFPLAQLRGAKQIPFGGSKDVVFRKTKGELFIVGIDFIPIELDSILKELKLSLKADGSLTGSHGAPAVAFFHAEHFQIDHGKRKPDNQARGDAAPFPFSCFSFSTWAVYHETGVAGNHRWYDAGTRAVAYGLDGNGGCSASSPHTRIDYLQAIAAVNAPGNTQQGFATDEISAYDVWDVGYGWPAHGAPVTSHSAIWADGNFSFSRSASLGW